MTINLTKPEKDPREIALALSAPSAAYPACQLCVENVGYAGRINHPPRVLLRTIPITLGGEQWHFQYSPYVYFNEHCIALSQQHTPMEINRKTYCRLADFQKQFPHYFIGSNAGLPIAGGSILSHLHFQGGRYVMPMMRAGIRREYPALCGVRLAVPKWPMPALQLRGRDIGAIIDAADKITAAWDNYSDEALGIYAFTNGEKHNTITPIMRMDGEEFVLELVLRGATEESARKFAAAVRKAVDGILAEGIPQELLLASLNAAEFASLERPGTLPDGVLDAINASTGWLHTGDPTLLLHTDRLFAFLREKLADGWFNELLRELFAPAPVQVVQVPTLPEKEEGEPIRTDGKLVLEHPLTVADLGDGARTAPGERELLAGAQLLHHPSAGSLYLNFYYDLGNVKPEDMPYLDLLTDVLDELDSTEHTAQQLNTLRSTWLGDSRTQLDIWTGRQEGAPCHAKLSLCLSLLERSLEKAVELGGEWLYDTILTGPAAEAAFARVLSQQKLNMEQQFIQQGNVYAATRASAHYTVDGAVSERCSGVSYYKFLCGVQERGNWAALGEKLDALRTEVLQHAELTVSLYGSEDALAKLRTLLPDSRFAAEGRAAAKPYVEPLTPPVNEAFIIDGGVNYDVQAWPMERRSDRKALARVMSYEYLWHNIREVGGAYGTGMLSSDGVEYLYTYRDPHVKESYDAFAKGPAELAAREYTEKDLNDFIVGTVAKLDTPRKPRAEARETDRRYFCGITDEMMAADRKALCAVDAALLKEQAAELGAAMANGVRVVFGSKDAVEAAKELFDTVETL